MGKSATQLIGVEPNKTHIWHKTTRPPHIFIWRPGREQPRGRFLAQAENAAWRGCPYDWALSIWAGWGWVGGVEFGWGIWRRN